MSMLFPDPLTRLIGQLVAILVVSRLLGLVTRRLGQPAVIAEIAAGILLGPSLLGWLAPGVGEVLFAPDSMPALYLVSQLGLLLFMFLVGLDLDFALLRGRGWASFAISHGGIVVPFALGWVLATSLHPTLSPPGVPLVTFAMFVGVAMSITAFPVLARILSERGMLRSPVGALAIACAAVDDVTAWCLLAVVVAVARAEAMSSVWATVAGALLFIAVMFFVVRPLLVRVGSRLTPSAGLSQNLVAAVLALVLVSSWTTELIGIHALFGAFLCGAVVPRARGLAAALTQRFEDVVVVLLLPLFFAYSGVRTEIGLLDSASDWGLCGLITATACVGKFGGGFFTARLSGIGWRESAAVGVLINTRGLMELVVLNVGLELGVISPKLFTMMVLMAVTTTFITSPLLQWIYPDPPRRT